MRLRILGGVAFWIATPQGRREMTGFGSGLVPD